jgi:N-acetylmuramic acid 6-phosphate etherase
VVLTTAYRAAYTAAVALDDLITEAGGAGGPDLDLRSTRELVGLMNAEDAKVAAVVAAAGDRIAAAIDATVERLARGGRLIYVGAGSSGRLAAVDAAECQATFSAPPWQVVALRAGAGGTPLEEEAAEDDAAAGAREAEALSLGPDDVVVAISASGRTPYVLGAVEAAGRAGALTVAVVSAERSELASLADHVVEVVVGPELLAGSTRLKAGTAQKLVLNTMSTVAMIRLGRTFGDQMVDVAATNAKLRARAHRIVSAATGAAPETVDAALAAGDGSAKVAIVALLAGIDAETARARLAAANGNVRTALGK